MYDIKLIKSRINCMDYAQKIGLSISKEGDRCVSPLRSNAKNSTSFIVWPDFYYDFSAGSGGDVIDFCANYKHGGDRGAAIRDLATMVGVVDDNIENSEEWLEYTHQMNAKTAYYNSKLTREDRQYLYSRGLTDNDIDRLKIGRVADGALKGRLFLPYFSGYNGYVCYYATRSMPNSTFPDNKYMKQKRDNHCQHLPWGLQTLNRDGDTLVIAEGYFDAVSFEMANYPVLSAITGRFSKDQIPVVLSVARKFKRVLIVYDNDAITRAGESFCHAMATILTRHRIPFVVGTVPEPYHDVSEFYASGGSLSVITDRAEDGIAYLASRIRDFDELESFVFTAARHTKRTAMDSLLVHLKRTTSFDAKLLDNLFKAATTAPPETIVCDEILKDHNLIYVDSVGFYEYNGSYWQKLSDTHVKSYADRAYGEFSTNQRVNAIVGLLKTRALQDVSFNKQPVWNFINGTLELDTGLFREHNPGDYCSFQASYPYNPEATYHSWSKFIDDVTCSDPIKSEILQFIPGYVLMPHCKYEKVFCLTGSGGNGKSKYLEIIRQIFGDENVTHITPRGLLDKFQRINLKDALFNVAGEIKSDLADSEEIIKLIASGEPLSACFKGLDYITFPSRAKLLFAMNGQLSSGDTSDGLARRLIIVDFKAQFVDFPDSSDPYQKLKDVDIVEKLSHELNSGGIFNWVYEGYKLLSTVGYFTETSDQVELIQDFKRSSNPVLQFYEESILPDRPPELKNKQLYSDYQVWCVANGYSSKPSNSFHREFKNVSRYDYTTFRTNSERGYRLKVTH